MVDEIEAAGARLVAVSPQRPRYSRELIDKHGLDFPILYDQGGNVARRYDLLYRLPDDLIEVYRELGIDLEETNGNSDWTLPMPARYVVDPDGVVRHARVGADYTRRPEPEETVEALTAMVA